MVIFNVYFLAATFVDFIIYIVKFDLANMLYYSARKRKAVVMLPFL